MATQLLIGRWLQSVLAMQFWYELQMLLPPTYLVDLTLHEELQNVLH